MGSDLDDVLERSDALQTAIDALIGASSFEGSTRADLVSASCLVAREHAISLRMLIAVGAGTSAISLLRLQYESVTRAMWLTWSASENWVEKLSAELSLETEQAAKGLPLQNEMLKQIEGRAPKPAYDMLIAFRDAQMKTLNSFVHGGLHPLARIQDGYPIPLLVNVVKCSNALSTMTVMLLAQWSEDASIVQAAMGFQLKFRDCLPELIATT